MFDDLWTVGRGRIIHVGRSWPEPDSTRSMDSDGSAGKIVVGGGSILAETAEIPASIDVVMSPPMSATRLVVFMVPPWVRWFVNPAPTARLGTSVRGHGLSRRGRDAGPLWEYRRFGTVVG
jgi:hypothetical protein